MDISPDISANSTIIFPNKKDNPLHDARVKVHVEDGRFFLQTTPQKFDIITAEPPPPLAAGVVNLFPRNISGSFMIDCRNGGVVTYWLPVWQIPPGLPRNPSSKHSGTSSRIARSGRAPPSIG